MSENKKRQRAFKYKMDDFCSTQLCAGKETCMLDPQRISVSEHNGPFLDLKRAATLIMQLSLSLLTVNNSTKRWPWQIWGEKGGVIIVPESENKDTEWWLNSSPSLFHTSYTSHTSVGCLQKKKKIILLSRSVMRMRVSPLWCSMKYEGATVFSISPILRKQWK